MKAIKVWFWYFLFIVIIFLSGCTVTFEKHTGITECDFAIMLTKMKSKKGNSAFEIGRYVDKCYEKLKEAK